MTGLCLFPVEKEQRFWLCSPSFAAGWDSSLGFKISSEEMLLLSSLCCRYRTGVWVIMVHYRQGTFHCYILSCVVSGDKRTTILISIRRKNTWLEPMKSALSFCHWLRPSGPNKVFPFESTAVGNCTGTLLVCRSVFYFSFFSLFLMLTVFVLWF